MNLITATTTKSDDMYKLDNGSLTRSSFDEIEKDLDDYSSLRNWKNQDLKRTNYIDSDDYIIEFDKNKSEVQISNENRITLLARKYISGKLSLEEESRLLIEKERVKQLIPLVTIEDYKLVGDMLADVKKIQDKQKAIKEKLNIK